MTSIQILPNPVYISLYKCDIRNCSCYGAVKHLEHGMKVVKRVFEKRFCIIVSVDEMTFCFMPVSGTIDAVFILRRMQE